MSAFWNLSTKAKLLISFLIVIALNLVVSFTALTAMNTTRNAADQIQSVANGAMVRSLKLPPSDDGGFSWTKKQLSVEELFDTYVSNSSPEPC